MLKKERRKRRRRVTDILDKVICGAILIVIKEVVEGGMGLW